MPRCSADEAHPADDVLGSIYDYEEPLMSLEDPPDASRVEDAMQSIELSRIRDGANA
jgi:hypothetical protein